MCYDFNICFNGSIAELYHLEWTCYKENSINNNKENSYFKVARKVHLLWGIWHEWRLGIKR